MLKSYDELRKVDVSKWVENRDGADYLNWAKVVDLLHENGAEKVYFEPVVNEYTGSSLFMTEQAFTDKNGIVNRVYETAVKIVIDDLEFIQRGPVTNGSNPVKDNSMTQQRLWNCQTRLFVKGVAIRTGLGFNLWLKNEQDDEKNSWEDDLSKHNIFKIQERMQQLVTAKMKQGISVEKIASNLGISEEEFKNYFTYFKILDRLEKRIGEMKE
ncbi:MAG: DUF1071 domain-containing protein [Clostridium sp.]|nr:DUF1071 domain-containing protein [Clostridium sp.]